MPGLTRKRILLSSSQEMLPSASKWKLSRLHQEHWALWRRPFPLRIPRRRQCAGFGLVGSTYYRERFRYALRLGIRGDLFDDFYYGLRVETSSNPALALGDVRR